MENLYILNLRKAFKKDACESEVKVDGTANFLVGQISHRKSFGVFRSAVHYMKACVCYTADAFYSYMERELGFELDLMRVFRKIY